MARTIMPLVIGAILGAVVAAIVLSPEARQGAATDTQASQQPRVSFTVPAPETDPEASTAAQPSQLAALRSPLERRSAALALLESSGYDEAVLARVAAELPPLEAVHFELEAIALLAERDPQAAIAAALALGDFAMRREALTRTAARLTLRDPEQALAAAAAIEDYELLNAYRAGVLRTWAEIDPQGLDAYLATARPEAIPNDADLFAAIALSSPERLILTARRFPPAQRATAETAAIASFAARDPLEAYARVEALGGEDRDARMRAAARGHAEQDAAAALAYLRSLPADDRTAVLEGIAGVDLLGVVDTLLGEHSAAGGDDRAPIQAMYALVFTRIATSSIDAGAVLDRLAALGDPQTQSTFDGVLGQWGTYHAEEALTWALTHSELVSESAYGTIARGLGNTNAELAMQTVDRLPANVRDTWIPSAAAGMARSDLGGALGWISRYREQAFYEDAVKSIIRSAADPIRGAADGQAQAAAEFLEGSSAAMRAELLPVVAAAWVRQEPAAAAEWVTSTELDPEAEQRRVPAVRNVVTIWARRDVGEALSFASGLPDGALRDVALGTALQNAATTGAIDTRLLETFSSEAAMQEALVGIAGGLASGSNPGLARELIDRYLTDPAQRGLAEDAIERGGLGGGVVGPGGGIGIFN